MSNLWDETNTVLRKHGKSFADVKAIQGDDFAISVDSFMELADVNYDSGFGIRMVQELS